MAAGKKGCLIVLIIIGALGFLLYPPIQGARSQLRALDEGVKTAWGALETQLQSRMDLIPNYVETIKSYAPQEQESYGAISGLHVRAAVTMTRPRKIEINSELTVALDRLGAVAERYPDLKKDQTFMTLQAKLAEIKNRIAEARVRYNEAATAFNTYRQGFLVVIVATLSGFSEAPLYDAKLPDASPALPVPPAEPKPSGAASGTQ
jgi:LemA protein